METGLILLGCACAALAVHPFLTYPLSLALLARVRPRPLAPIKEGLGPSKPHSPATGDGGGSGGGGGVALCVCAYNEASVIRAKAENMLAMRAASPELDLLVYVDGASDSTAEILAEYADRITVVASPIRQGKTHGMNTLVARTRADVVVFSDANVVFAPDTIPRLLRPFADPGVGCVCGHLIYTAPDGNPTAATGSLYWRFEERIKELESRTGSVMGADGSVFAIRRALHAPPPGDIIDDMYVSLSVLCDGHRVVRAGDALAHEATVSRPAEEFRRKIRIACQAFNVHRLLRPRLRRLGALDRYKYASHKLLRWFTAYLLVGAAAFIAAGLALAEAWWLLGFGLATLTAFVFSARLRPAGAAGCAFEILGAFIATGLGVLRSLRGDRFQTWTPPASARALVDPGMGQMPNAAQSAQPR
jgi:cellulose synthase/poly-beta-1,6-N-acetylglucosamine synthase-like glycosyltransferase